MDAGEYWLLDSVVESRDSLAMLVSKDIETAFNKRSHGLTRDQLINVLERLFFRGDLLARLMEKSVPKEFFIPTRTEIEEAFNGQVRCFYGLTSQGGARWEEVSQPHWERYIHDSVYAEPREGEIIGSDRHLVERYDTLSRYSEISVVPGSKHWDVLRPWQATYWKELPVGHRLRFKYQWVERTPEPKTDPNISEWFKEIHYWYTPYSGS